MVQCQGQQFNLQVLTQVLVVTFKGILWDCQRLYHWIGQKILSCLHVKHFEIGPVVLKFDNNISAINWVSQQYCHQPGISTVVPSPKSRQCHNQCLINWYTITQVSTVVPSSDSQLCHNPCLINWVSYQLCHQPGVSTVSSFRCLNSSTITFAFKIILET